jgi:hypothetical protein
MEEYVSNYPNGFDLKFWPVSLSARGRAAWLLKIPVGALVLAVAYRIFIGA